MKTKLKKIKQGLKIATAGILAAVTVSAGVVGYSNAKLADYATDEQISTIAEQLNCDTSYLKKRDNHFTMMQHNGDEPIYVYFDESVSAEDKAVATESLDYVFGVIGEINESYKYKIVDNEEYQSKKGKTTIKYSTGDPETQYNGGFVDVEGTATSVPNLLSKFTNKRTDNRFYINIRNNEGKNQSHEDRLYTYIHELLHLVGFDDVHTLKSMANTNKYYGNTIMQSSHGGKVACVLTPNDYKALMSICTEKLGEEELIKRIGDYKEKIANYEQEYYEYFAEKVVERSRTTEKLEQDDLDYKGSITATMLDGTKHQHFYELHIRGNKYKFKIYNKNSELIDSATGEVFWHNGVAVLKSIKLKQGMQPGVKDESYEGGYVEDWSLIANGNHVELYNVFNNSSYWLTPIVLEETLQP